MKKKSKSKKRARAKSTAVVVYTPPQTVLEMIDRAARDPKIDVGKMKELLAMRQTSEMLEAERAYNEAMVAAQFEIPVIGKNAKGEKEGSRYATLDKINKLIGPILAKHGFSLSFGTVDSPIADSYRVTCVCAKGSYSRTYMADVPINITGPKGAPIMTRVQGFGSAMSYARRYLTVMIINIVISDEDDDGAAPRISAEEVTALTEMTVAAGANMGRLLKFLGVASLADLPAKRYDEAFAAIQAKANEKSAPKQVEQQVPA
jgi:hypothetical protein